MAWMLDRAAGYLQVRGRFTQARVLAERAVHINETIHGPNHSSVAGRLNNLAGILQDLGHLDQAKPPSSGLSTSTRPPTIPTTPKSPPT
jgi:hypothetical protein